MRSRIAIFLPVGLWVKCPVLKVETVSTSHCGNIFSTRVPGILDGQVSPCLTKYLEARNSGVTVYAFDWSMEVLKCCVCLRKGIKIICALIPNACQSLGTMSRVQ